MPRWMDQIQEQGEKVFELESVRAKVVNDRDAAIAALRVLDTNLEKESDKLRTMIEKNSEKWVTPTCKEIQLEDFMTIGVKEQDVMDYGDATDDEICDRLRRARMEQLITIPPVKPKPDKRGLAKLAAEVLAKIKITKTRKSRGWWRFAD